MTHNTTTFMKYARHHYGAMVGISLICVAAVVGSGFLALWAEQRAIAAERQFQTNVKLMQELQVEVLDLKEDVENLDQRCDYQWDEGYDEAGIDYEILDPPYEDWGC